MQTSKTETVLTSQWGSLSPHLLASFYVVNYKEENGKSVWERDNSIIVKAPIIQGGNFDVTPKWESPFEGAGAEAKAGSLFALLQSGKMQSIVDSFVGWSDKLNDWAKKKAGDFENRSGITKLNSTQIFTGIEPIKFSFTLLFRAWQNAFEEVERPVDQLMQWALPVEVPDDVGMISRIAKGVTGRASEDTTYVDTITPSRAPVRIGMTFKGRSFYPLVIESISPSMLDAPVNSNGDAVSMEVQMTLCSLNAIDRNDWIKSRR